MSDEGLGMSQEKRGRVLASAGEVVSFAGKGMAPGSGWQAE